MKHRHFIRGIDTRPMGLMHSAVRNIDYGIHLYEFDEEMP